MIAISPEYVKRDRRSANQKPRAVGGVRAPVTMVRPLACVRVSLVLSPEALLAHNASLMKMQTRSKLAENLKVEPLNTARIADKDHVRVLFLIAHDALHYYKLDTGVDLKAAAKDPSGILEDGTI